MNVGRPREFNSEQALDAAMHLFWHKGYEATSMQDLLLSMNLSKSSLYQTYGNKHSLFQQCLSLYQDKSTELFERGLKEARSGKKFIENMFAMLLSSATRPEKRIGCLVINTAAEFSQREPEIAQLTLEATEAFTQVFQSAIELGQRNGDINAQKDAAQLAAYIMANVAGVNMMIKAGTPENTLQLIVTEVLRSLK